MASKKKVTHYLITNRSVYSRGKKEYINDDGTEGAGYDLRFGTLHFDPSRKISSVSGDIYMRVAIGIENRQQWLVEMRAEQLVTTL